MTTQYDEMGNVIGDDGSYPMEHIMAHAPSMPRPMPLQANGSDVPYVVSEIPQTQPPVQQPVQHTPQTPPPSQSFLERMTLPIQAAMTHMPGAAFVQGITPAVQFPFQVAGGTAYALANRALNPDTADFNADTSKFMENTTMPAQSKAGQEFGNVLGEIAQRTGPLPELMGLHPALSADDMRVALKQNVERVREIKNIPTDYVNAKSGISRESNLGGKTYGENLKNAAYDIADVAARQAARRSESAPAMTGSVQVFSDLVPDTRKYMMQGDQSFLWDKDSEARALALEAEDNPKTDAEIHYLTGTSRGGDNFQRQELSDVGALVNPGFFELYKVHPQAMGKLTHQLPDVYEHPSIFTAYPQLRHIVVRVGKLGKASAQYDEVNKILTIDSGIMHDPRLVKEAIEHEITHEIQVIQGWEKGGNSDMFPSKKIAETAQFLEQIMQQYNVSAEEAAKMYKKQFLLPHKVDLDAIRYANDWQGSLLPNTDPVARYQHMHGEIEAETGLGRSDLEQNQLHRFYPWAKDPKDVEGTLPQFTPNPYGRPRGRGAPIGVDPSNALYRSARNAKGDYVFSKTPKYYRMPIASTTPVAQMSAELATKPELQMSESKPVDLTKRKLFGLGLKSKDQLPAVIPTATSQPLTTSTSADTNVPKLNTINLVDAAAQALLNMPMSRRQVLKTPINAAISHAGRGFVGDLANVTGGMSKNTAINHAVDHITSTLFDYDHPAFGGTLDDETRDEISNQLTYAGLSKASYAPAEHFAKHLTENDLKEAYHRSADRFHHVWTNADIKGMANDSAREAVDALGPDVDYDNLLDYAHNTFQKAVVNEATKTLPNNVSGDIAKRVTKNMLEGHDSLADPYGTDTLPDAVTKAVSDFYNDRYNTYIENIINDEEGGGSSVSHIKNMVSFALKPLEEHLSKEEFQEIKHLYSQLTKLDDDALNADLTSNPTAVKLKNDFLVSLDKIPLKDKTAFPFSAIDFPATLEEQYQDVMGVDTALTPVDEVEKGLRHFAEQTGQEYEPPFQIQLEEELKNETDPQKIENIKHQLKTYKNKDRSDLDKTIEDRYNTFIKSTPIAQMEAELATKPEIQQSVKEKGGNWLDRTLNNHLRTLKQGINPSLAPDSFNLAPNWRDTANEIGFTPEHQEEFAKTAALNQFVDRRLSPYIKNEMGTPTDSVRDLADQGISHLQDLQFEPWISAPTYNKRRAANMPTEGYAKNDAGKEWEMRTDEAIKNTKAGSAANSPASLEDYPWVRPLANKNPNAPIHAMPNRDEFNELGFDHLMDELRSSITGNVPQHLALTIKDLERMTLPEAVRHVAKINEYREAQMSKTAAKSMEDFPAVKVYADKSKWHDLKLPEMSTEFPEGYSLESSIKEFNEKHAKLDDVLKNEGKMMGHCVGNYTDAVASGNTKIFTLRDKSNKPHATVEMNVVAPRWDELPNDVKGLPAEQLDQWIKNNPTVLLNQFKGKSNKPVIEKYRDQALDLLNNPPNIHMIYSITDEGRRDLAGAGIIDRNDTSSVLQHLTPAIIGSWGKGTEQFNKLVEQHPDLPRFISVDELKQLFKKQKPEGYKDGGSVYMAEGGDPAAMREALFEANRKAQAEKAAIEEATRPRTYAERLQDMGRLPTPEAPKSLKGSGGVGFVPGSRNPFNPDSPLNKKNGGAVHMVKGGQPEGIVAGGEFQHALNQPGLKHKFTEDDLIRNMNESVVESFDRSKARKRIEPILMEAVTNPAQYYTDGQELLHPKTSVPLGKAPPAQPLSSRPMEDLSRQHMPLLEPNQQMRRGDQFYKKGGLAHRSNGGTIPINEMRIELLRKKHG